MSARRPPNPDGCNRQCPNPNQATIRAIEQGKDVRLSNVERVARALGLTLELVR